MWSRLSARRPSPARIDLIRPWQAPLVAVEVSAINVHDRAEIESRIGAFTRSSNGGLIVTTSALTTIHRDLSSWCQGSARPGAPFASPQSFSRLHPSRLSKRLPRACRPVSANRSRDRHSKVRSGLIHPPNRGQPTPSSDGDSHDRTNEDICL